MGSVLQRPPASWLPTMLVLNNPIPLLYPTQPVCYLACLGLSCSLLKCLPLLSIPPQPTPVGFLEHCGPGPPGSEPRS